MTVVGAVAATHVSGVHEPTVSIPTHICDLPSELRDWEIQHRKERKKLAGKTTPILIRAGAEATAEKAVELLRSLTPLPSVGARQRLLQSLDGRHAVDVRVFGGEPFGSIESLAQELGFTACRRPGFDPVFEASQRRSMPRVRKSRRRSSAFQSHFVH